jgi:hypothetical protein
VPLNLHHALCSFKYGATVFQRVPAEHDHFLKRYGNFFIRSVIIQYYPYYLIHNYYLATSLLRRGLHEVSSEGKVSAQGVMGRAK